MEDRCALAVVLCGYDVLVSCGDLSYWRGMVQQFTRSLTDPDSASDIGHLIRLNSTDNRLELRNYAFVVPPSKPDRFYIDECYPYECNLFDDYVLIRPEMDSEGQVWKIRGQFYQADCTILKASKDENGKTLNYLPLSKLDASIIFKEISFAEKSEFVFYCIS